MSVLSKLILGFQNLPYKIRILLFWKPGFGNLTQFEVRIPGPPFRALFMVVLITQQFYVQVEECPANYNFKPYATESNKSEQLQMLGWPNKFLNLIG